MSEEVGIGEDEEMTTIYNGEKGENYHGVEIYHNMGGTAAPPFLK